jgi:hypothetical protein
MFGRKERHARTANGSPKRSRRLERGWIEEDVASDEWRDKKRPAARHETNGSGDEALSEFSGLHRRVWLAG